MFKFVVSILIVSLNLFYAVSSHADDLIAREVVSAEISSNSDSHHNDLAPEAIHFCHLAHCGFVPISNVVTLVSLDFISSLISPVNFAWRFLDQEIEPPIYT